MAKLSKAARAALPRDRAHFLVPSKAPGSGSYPIPDAKHRAIAKGLAGMHHHPGIERKADMAIKAHKGEHRTGNIDHSSPRSHDMKRGRPVQGGNGMGHHPPHHRSHGLSHEQYMAGGAKPVNIMDTDGDYDGD